MKKLKIYIDTSVIGYLYQETQPEKMADTRKLWKLIKQGEYQVVISELLFEELNANPNEEIKKTLLGFLAEIDYQNMQITEEIEELAQLVVETGILTQKSYDDCVHIACAIINDCDVLVSWNFKHLVNIRTINGVRGLSNIKGYGNIDIVQPTILIQNGDEADDN